MSHLSALTSSSVVNTAVHALPALDITRLAGHLGAQVHGIRLSGALDTATFAAIQQALQTHKVLFFRAQQHLDDAEHQAFARLFGGLVDHPTVPSQAGSQILELDSYHGGRADSWHTDVTFDLDYPKVAVLRSIVIPPVGGDTVWANTARAYADLPEALKTLADQLWAVHSNQYDYAARRLRQDDDAARRYREVFAARTVETEHPLVQVHPETGERTLVAGHFVKRFVGYNSHDAVFCEMLGRVDPKVAADPRSCQFFTDEQDASVLAAQSTKKGVVHSASAGVLLVGADSKHKMRFKWEPTGTAKWRAQYEPLTIEGLALFLGLFPVEERASVMLANDPSDTKPRPLLPPQGTDALTFSAELLKREPRARKLMELFP